MPHVPAREIPVPTSISVEARAAMEMGVPGPVFGNFPALDDIEGWRSFVAQRDEFVMLLVKDLITGYAGTIQERPDGPCPVYVVTPDGVADDDRRVFLHLHGGGWCLGGGGVGTFDACMMATALGARVWAPDYRMAPDHPFPTPLDDCLAIYRQLLTEREPEQIVIGGNSAGANLSAALILRAADEGLPLPAAVVLNTGAFDLTEAGDTLQTNLGLDDVIRSPITPVVRLYAGGHDLDNPYLSPLFGDLSCFPPTIILSGTRDMLLSDNVRLHRALRAAGVPAELHVWEAAGHGNFFGMAPEDADRNGEMRRFATAHWK